MATLLTASSEAVVPINNLVTNGDGGGVPATGWSLTNGGDGWGKRGDISFDSTPGCYVTSYLACKRSQTIDLLAAGATAAELDASPEILFSEAITYDRNNNGQDTYYMKVELRGASQNVLASWNSGTEAARLAAPATWTVLKNAFKNYPAGVRYVYIEDGGVDVGYWAGHYGTFHDATTVRIVVDSDGDLIDDYTENLYGLDKNNPADAAFDKDGDGVSNGIEYDKGMRLDLKDTDGDGLEDGEELDPANDTDPLVADTDADGVSDGVEVKTHFSDPHLTDTDGDFYPDGYEDRDHSSLTDPNEWPGGVKIELAPGAIPGTALLTSDMTDPENDGSDASATGANFNWTAITASTAATFTGEAAFNLFDNQIGSAANSKWLYTGTAAQWVTVQFATLTSLDSFTITSGNDLPERDPRVWEIQGSLDGITYKTIYRFDWTRAALWTDRNQVLKVTLPKGSLPYYYLRYSFNAAGASTQLSEIEFYGEQTNDDIDLDGIPKLYEDYYDFLSDSDPNDGFLDEDVDGLNNKGEYLAKSNPLLTDTDGDLLSDGEEAGPGGYGSSPLLLESDGDTLSDYLEVTQHGSSPALADTDSDFFRDDYEVSAGSGVNDSNSSPNNTRVTLAPAVSPALPGTALVGSDLTDPENDGSDATATGTAFNWSAITATTLATFSGEGAFNLFDNKIGAVANSKWLYNSTATQSVTVSFSKMTALDYFTITSGNDSPERDARVWEIQGSKNGTTFETITRFAWTPAPIFTARNQVLKVALPQRTYPYTHYRYVVFSSGGGTHQTSELEFFGDQTEADADGDGIPKLYEDYYDFLSDSDPNDALQDADGDGLNNKGEYLAKSDPLATDTDGDLLTDGQEAGPGGYGSSPLLVESDGDTLSDYLEVTQYGSSPALADTDSDFFRDDYEVSAASGVNDSNSSPNGTRVTLAPAVSPALPGSTLVGSDLTDPENDGSDATAAGTLFNWTSITATIGASFATEGAYNVFDNKIGSIANSKWLYNSTATQSVTVRFPLSTSLDYFTITSGNDSPERDARVWEIQGSNDGTTFDTITRFAWTPAQIFTARNQVLKVALPKRAFPYTYFRYVVFSSGGGTHQTSELEFFGIQSNADGDSDGVPKLWEEYYGLSDSNGADADVDTDGDHLSNKLEYAAKTNPLVKDTDGDGLWDGDEAPANALPLVKDTDGDGLWDGDEVNLHHTLANSADSDLDTFKDGYEVLRGTNPLLGSSTPDGLTYVSRGTGTAALLTGDITDRDNDGSDANATTGTGFDWKSISATNKASFQTTEGAFNVFDNKVGGGEAKWCCDPPSPTVPAQRVTVEFDYGVRLTHFTMASSDDAPERDPRAWKILGSNDGVTFTPIVNHSDTTMTFWGTTRNHVVRFNLATPAPMYKWFRYEVTATNSTMHALGEIEYFGIDQDTDGDLMPDYYEAKYAFLDLNDPTDASEDIGDGDGLTNLQEFQNKTRPDLADTDGDLINDGYEVTKGSNPKLASSLPNFTAVDWGTATNITGTLADIDTSGTKVHAWTGGASPVTVSELGLTFTPGPSLGNRLTGFDPLTRTNASYDALLDSGTYAAGAKFLEIPGLTPGQTYRIQVWLADTRSGSGDRLRRFGTYDAADEKVTLHSGTFGSTATYPGQFVTGIITAEAKSEYLYIEGLEGAQYNALTVFLATSAPLQVISTVRNPGNFQLTVSGFNTAKSYRLYRSQTLLNDWTPVGDPFTPTSAVQSVGDFSPPAGKAFYKVEELP